MSTQYPDQFALFMLVQQLQHDLQNLRLEMQSLRDTVQHLQTQCYGSTAHSPVACTRVTESTETRYRLQGPNDSALPVWECDSHISLTDVTRVHLPSLFNVSTDYA